MSVEESKLEPGKIHIVDFRIIEGRVQSPIDFMVDQVAGHDFDIEFNLGFNLADQLVRADFKVEVRTKSEGQNEEEATGLFRLIFVFHVENLRDLAIPDKNDQIEVNGALGNALSSITYSTSRGVLMARFQGTALEDFIMPVIDPNSLLRNNV